MPKLKPDTQRARREHILDAAERCFARSGFHRCTMHDICREAEISPGALYVYFASKEALIAGLAERDRSEFAERFSVLANAPDVMQALSALAVHYFEDEPAHKRLMGIEIGTESTRNPQVGEIFHAVDDFVLESFEALFDRLRAEGRIAPALDSPTLARMMAILGDGMIWRRATDPKFEGARLIPAVIELVAALIRPTAGPHGVSDRSSPREAAE